MTAQVGVKLSSGVLGSAWQPSQALMTYALALVLRWERFSWLGLSGILLGTAGAIFMVTWRQQVSGNGCREEATASSGILCMGTVLDKGGQLLLANSLFFINCLATSGYVLFAKVALRRYDSLTVTAFANAAASLLVAAVAFPLSKYAAMRHRGRAPSCSALHFVCPQSITEMQWRCGDYVVSCSPWGLPQHALGPLAYMVFGQSVACYFLMTWATGQTRASNILVYSALNPAAAAALTALLVNSNHFVYLQQMPITNSLGTLAILGGLALVLIDDHSQALMPALPTPAPLGSSRAKKKLSDPEITLPF
eukprot:scaffold4412_cov401-Prasinococcus_capsulatus_cf.AAC.2